MIRCWVFSVVDGRGWARHLSRVVVNEGYRPLVFIDHVGDQVRVEEEKEDGDSGEPCGSPGCARSQGII